LQLVVVLSVCLGFRRKVDRWPDRQGFGRAHQVLLVPLVGLRLDQMIEVASTMERGQAQEQVLLRSYPMDSWGLVAPPVRPLVVDPSRHYFLDQGQPVSPAVLPLVLPLVLPPMPSVLLVLLVVLPSRLAFAAAAVPE
jgi:hypothetical protein